MSDAATRAAREINQMIANHYFASTKVTREESMEFYEAIADFCAESIAAIKEDIAQDERDR